MLKRILWIFVIIFAGMAVIAQETECPDFIYDYIVQASEACATTGRNEVCYGSTAIDVQARGSAELVFAEPGDITALENLERIQTSGLDRANGDFGIALMQVQADVEGSLPGQVVTFLLMGNVEVDGLNEAETPMQAFRFRTGIGAPTCENSNYDALMIDSPDGLTINFNVNGVDIELGSTAIIVGKPDNKIDMLVIEGQGRVTAMGETVIVEEGFWTQIPMDIETGTAAVGAPEEPVPFGAGRVVHLPLDVLYTGQNIAIGKPVSADASLETNPATNLVNGISDDAWSAGSEGNHFIEIDLLQEYSIAAIRLLSAEAGATYTLSVADSGGEFSLGQDFVAENDSDLLSFEPENSLLFSRYVRIETNASSLGEIEVEAAGFYGCVLIPAEASGSVNLRNGAGTDFEIVGALGESERAIAIGQAIGTDNSAWWQLEDGAWLRQDIVTGRGACSYVPVVEN